MVKGWGVAAGLKKGASLLCGMARKPFGVVLLVPFLWARVLRRLFEKMALSENLWSGCGGWGRSLAGISKRVFENKSLIKNRKSFWVPPFFKRRRLLKLFGKSFTKNFCNFSMLLRLTFQTIFRKRGP
ncbi:hypothetical protein [Novacetimonas sp. GS1]|uniref:hypothetical protein n=1 Tax=Novacetimonas sp. GS1 TaxID=3119990 RepID=UPI002FCD0A55